MFTPELRGLSPDAVAFLKEVQSGLGERPLVDKIRLLSDKVSNKVVDVFNRHTSRILLACSVSAISLGFVLGNLGIFVGGIYLGAKLQQRMGEKQPF